MFKIYVTYVNCKFSYFINIVADGTDGWFTKPKEALKTFIGAGFITVNFIIKFK